MGSNPSGRTRFPRGITQTEVASRAILGLSLRGSLSGATVRGCGNASSCYFTLLTLMSKCFVGAALQTELRKGMLKRVPFFFRLSASSPIATYSRPALET